jgi:hypothetical protein
MLTSSPDVEGYSSYAFLFTEQYVMKSRLKFMPPQKKVELVAQDTGQRVKPVLLIQCVKSSLL